MKFSEYLLSEEFLAGDNRRQRFGTDDPAAFLEVHKNPDKTEVLSIITDFAQSNPAQYRITGRHNKVRGFFDMEGNLYVWYVNFFHDNVEEFLQKQEKTKSIRKNENFRFSWLKDTDELTLERDEHARYFKDLEESPLKRLMIKRLIRAFPDVETEDKKGLPDVKTNSRGEGWVPAIDSDDEGEADGSANSTSGGRGKTVKEKNGFAVGDVITMKETLSDNKDIKKGMKGTILEITTLPPELGIEFKVKIDGGHSCRGKGKADSCWYVGFDYIEKEKIPEKAPNNSPKVDVKKIAKMGDTIVFKDGSRYAKNGKEVKILAIATAKTGEYNYIFKSRKKDDPAYTADMFHDPKHKITFIDGKFNIKKANEPFSVIMAPESLVRMSSSSIKEIIPDPARLEKLPNNLYEPKNYTSKGYTNPDRMELKENIK